MVWQEPILLYFATDILAKFIRKRSASNLLRQDNTGRQEEIDSDGGKILTLLSGDLFKAS